jgi:hypothetical protein
VRTTDKVSDTSSAIADGAATDASGSNTISAEDDYVRSDLPSRQEADQDEDYRPRSRQGFDVRRGQYSQDAEHVRILSILYYVFGGLGILSGVFPLIYVVLGAVMVAGGMGGPGRGGPPPEMGWFFIVIGGGISLLFWTMAGCTLFAGYSLGRRQRYMFCFVIACLCCMSMPLGTILGVFTIIVLVRPAVKEMFERGSAAASPALQE